MEASTDGKSGKAWSLTLSTTLHQPRSAPFFVIKGCFRPQVFCRFTRAEDVLRCWRADRPLSKRMANPSNRVSVDTERLVSRAAAVFANTQGSINLWILGAITTSPRISLFSGFTNQHPLAVNTTQFEPCLQAGLSRSPLLPCLQRSIKGTANDGTCDVAVLTA